MFTIVRESYSYNHDVNKFTKKPLSFMLSISIIYYPSGVAHKVTLRALIFQGSCCINLALITFKVKIIYRSERSLATIETPT